MNMNSLNQSFDTPAAVYSSPQGRTRTTADNDSVQKSNLLIGDRNNSTNSTNDFMQQNSQSGWPQGSYKPAPFPNVSGGPRRHHSIERHPQSNTYGFSGQHHPVLKTEQYEEGEVNI